MLIICVTLEDGNMIRFDLNLILQVLFDFTRVIQSNISPSIYNYSSAEGTRASVYPIGYPHSLVLHTLADYKW